ncbi:hypothetical protein B0H15DRAFT_807669 [Mycena belliarum]|uniref:Uncharacterized protein n=1 Tax=Mycena belliarum TaxID=1033014 RepID=A0AAD6TKG0_9AGAR|nr:hypothetical protein B0H15DRAFT_807669 [Mycena belliae]
MSAPGTCTLEQPCEMELFTTDTFRGITHHDAALNRGYYLVWDIGAYTTSAAAANVLQPSNVCRFETMELAQEQWNLLCRYYHCDDDSLEGDERVILKTRDERLAEGDKRKAHMGAPHPKRSARSVSLFADDKDDLPPPSYKREPDTLRTSLSASLSSVSSLSVSSSGPVLVLGASVSSDPNRLAGRPLTWARRGGARARAAGRAACGIEERRVSVVCAIKVSRTFDKSGTRGSKERGFGKCGGRTLEERNSIEERDSGTLEERDGGTLEDRDSGALEERDSRALEERDGGPQERDGGPSRSATAGESASASVPGAFLYNRSKRLVYKSMAVAVDEMEASESVRVLRNYDDLMECISAAD